MKIVFMGTPDFAVEILKTLHEAGIEIPAIVTVADKAAGRGKKIRKSAVKLYAEENMDCDILQPLKLKDEDFVNQLASYNADLFVVVAFRMLPKIVWSMPNKGTINLHGSLLPQYRGAAPINWAVINGEAQSGVTTFFIREEIDTGDIIDQATAPILENTSAGELHDTLMYIGAKLVLKTVKEIEEGKILSYSQESTIKETTALQAAPKIFKDTCKIDWNNTSKNIHNHIRGLSPYPAAWTEMQNAKGDLIAVKLFKTLKTQKTLSPGEILTDNKTQIEIGTQDGAVLIEELQLAGKKRMSTADFLRGYSFDENSKMI